jgi:signal transduction histidine kinase
LIDDKGQDYGDAAHPFQLAMASGKTVRDNKATLLTRSNNKLSTDFTVSPLLSAHGGVSGAIAIFRDVSQERSEEHQRAEFISTASHEMRTPVAAIEGYVALALNDHVSKIDDKARDYLLKAHSSTQHLGKLFQDLLTSAKAEDGRLVNHPSVVDLGNFLEQLTESFKFAADKKGLGMEFSVGQNGAADGGLGGGKVIKPLYYVYVDPDRLREVITNLFDNAVKYTPSGKINIGLTGNKDLVQFYIKDTGAGIPADDIPHLFQKFYRVDNSTTRTIGGTGLGLFICRKIVELYDGRIWVDSKLNVGSTFYINLPRVDNAKATKLLATEAAAQSPIA